MRSAIVLSLGFLGSGRLVARWLPPSLCCSSQRYRAAEPSPASRQAPTASSASSLPSFRRPGVDDIRRGGRKNPPASRPQLGRGQADLRSRRRKERGPAEREALGGAGGGEDGRRRVRGRGVLDGAPAGASETPVQVGEEEALVDAALEHRGCRARCTSSAPHGARAPTRGQAQWASDGWALVIFLRTLDAPTWAAQRFRGGRRRIGRIGHF